MLMRYIAAMNVIANTTENFSRPPVYENPDDEGNDYIWIEEMLEGPSDDDETPERRAFASFSKHGAQAARQRAKSFARKPRPLMRSFRLRKGSFGTEPAAGRQRRRNLRHCDLNQYSGGLVMAHDRPHEFGFDPEGLLEKFCPECGELRPVRVERDAKGTKHYFCAKCQAPLGEETGGSFDKPDFS